MNVKSFVKNVADPEQVKEAAVKEKHGRDRDLDDVASILSTSRGRRFYWRVLSMCGVFRISYSSDPYATAFNEGHRNVGNPLLADAMEISLADYMKMADEAKLEGR